MPCAIAAQGLAPSHARTPEPAVGALNDRARFKRLFRSASWSNRGAVVTLESGRSHGKQYGEPLKLRLKDWRIEALSNGCEVLPERGTGSPQRSPPRARLPSHCPFCPSVTLSNPLLTCRSGLFTRKSGVKGDFFDWRSVTHGIALRMINPIPQPVVAPCIGRCLRPSRPH